MLDNDFGIGNRIHRMKFWCQKILPLVYDDSLSYLEVLYKVVHYLNDVVSQTNALTEIVEIHETDITQLKEDMKYLQDEFEKVKNGDYVSLYLDALINWIDKNIQQLVGRIVKYVVFGLTDDGYFTAWIPESWQFIQFDTSMDMDNELYGHLILRW